MEVVVWVKPGKVAARFEVAGKSYSGVIGRNGPVLDTDKREGDGMTPVGTYEVLFGMYRADRGGRPLGGGVWMALTPEMGWGDDPASPLYNAFCPASHPACREEALWREDSAYDYVVALSHNTPPRPGPNGEAMGSAVFFHVWRPEATHTGGCMALRREDFEAVFGLGITRVSVRLEG